MSTRKVLTLCLTAFVIFPAGLFVSTAAACTDQGQESAETTPDSNGWGNPNTLLDHFARHGGDFNAQSPEEYAQDAQRFELRYSDPNVEVKEDPSGVVRMWDPATDEFGAYNADGTTRTFYKPDPAFTGHPDNQSYWDEQSGSDPRGLWP